MLTEIDTKELEYILEVTPPEQNIMIAGKHGIGKSKIIENFFTAKGKKVVTFFCSQAADPGDIIGLPHYDETSGKTEFALPWWFPTDGQPVVLFLDELNRARPEILQVVMDLTLNRRLAGRKLPEGSQIISAINEGDEYQLTDLDPALVSRFNVYGFAPAIKEWIEWANASGIDTRVTSFIATNTKFLDSKFADDATALDKTPDRRAWERISNIIKKYPVLGPNTAPALKKVFCGIVGPSAAVAFYDSIIKNAFVTPDELLSDFNGCEHTLKSYDLQGLVNLNDNICSFIDSSLGDLGENPEKEAMYATNLHKYFGFLSSKSMKEGAEAFAHFISDYETGSYPMLNYLVANNGDTLEKSMNDFLTRTKTV